MEKSTSLGRSRNMMIGFHPKSMRTNPEMAKRDDEDVHQTRDEVNSAQKQN
jgi:hypothetical protein